MGPVCAPMRGKDIMKRILLTLAKIIGVIVIFLGAAVFFREELIVWRLGPPDTFEEATAPAAPNYADLHFWAAHPEKTETSDLRLPGAGEADTAAQLVDVFYVHPTTYMGPGLWNSEMALDHAPAQTLETMLGGHGTIFTDCCRFYAPRYREAHIAAFNAAYVENGMEALDFAYRDVEAAFDYFLEHFNEGRPFIIAGHSQGSLHAMRLLELRVDKRAIRDQLVAAYPIGFWFPEDRLDRGFANLNLCAAPGQTGCLITYDVFGDGSIGRDPEGRMPQWYATGWEYEVPARTLCINPISWEVNGEVMPRDQHKGGMPLVPTFAAMDILLNRNNGVSYDALVDPIPNLTSAVCREDGSLMVEAEETLPHFSKGVDDSQMYHTYDWQLFYLDIKDNVELQVANYFRSKQPIDVAETAQ